jgi:WD40-like Beta Propeller Repeat
MHGFRPTIVVVLALSALTILMSGQAYAAFPGVNGRIAFSQCDSDSCSPWRVHAVNPDGSGGSFVFPSSDSQFYEDPAYSADGREIVAQACLPGPGLSYNCGISEIAANGTGSRALTPIVDGANDDYPAFAPDGSTIAFERGPLGGGADIWAMAADGSGARALTSGTDSDSDPRFSPDGQTIAFDRYSSAQQHIWAMNADGSNPHMLTNGSTAQDYSPDFSPDGSTIAFGHCGGGQCGIWLMNANGDNPHALTAPTAGLDDYEPAFSPDGTQIVFERSNGTIDTLEVLTLAGGGIRSIPVGDDYRPAWGRVPTPSIDSPPTIGGTARLGHALTAASGPTPWGGTAGFQWLRCGSAGSGCAAIVGATAASYAPKGADKGKRLRVRQTQTSAGGSISSDSAPTGTVLGEPGASIARIAAVVGGRALIKLGCPAAQNGVCAGNLTLTASLTASASRKRTIKAGRAKFRIAAGKRKTLKVKLSRKARALVHAKGRLKVKVTTVTKDSSGIKTTARKSVTLRPKGKRRS